MNKNLSQLISGEHGIRVDYRVCDCIQTLNRTYSIFKNGTSYVYDIGNDMLLINSYLVDKYVIYHEKGVDQFTKEEFHKHFIDKKMRNELIDIILL